MNYVRLILGGLVAGVILNVGEFVLNDFILGAQMKAFFAAHDFPESGGNLIAVAVVLTFILGIVIVLTYAMIRPRFGPGPRTAIIASLISWFGVYVYAQIIYGLVFSTPMNAIVIGIGWGLVEYALAALAGAWVYKEA